MELNGIRIAASMCVTRIRFSSRETQRRDGGSQVLLAAGPIRRRAATADASRERLPLTRSRRRLADAPAFMPTFVQDDGRFRFSAELFIVARSAHTVDTPRFSTLCQNGIRNDAHQSDVRATIDQPQSTPRHRRSQLLRGLRIRGPHPH